MRKLAISLMILGVVLLLAAIGCENGLTFKEPSFKIAFDSNRDGNTEIYIMDTNGANQTRLTTYSHAVDWDPAISPDGEKIAFVSDRDWHSGYPSSEIYVMNVDGTSETRLTNDSTYDDNPVWSPDSTKIAFTSISIPGTSDIYVINSDGSGRTRLTVSGDAFYPTWSPRGDEIALARDPHGEGINIFKMKSDGTDVVNNKHPAWSPDRSKIAFTSYRDGDSEIYVMNSDGSNQTRLTNNTAWDEYPTWSPDGSRIAFVSTRDGNDEIYSMKYDGSDVTRLTNNSARDECPDWGWIDVSE